LERFARWLTLPALALVAAALILPVLLVLATAVRDPELRATLPHTASLLRDWDGRGLPGEDVFAAAAAELRAADAGQSIGGLAQRLNFERTGMRGLLIRTATASLAPPYAMALPAIHAGWADPDTWLVLRRAALGATPLYLLRAVDLDLSPAGDIRAVPAREAVFLPLFGRTFVIAVVVTLVCLLLAYPLAWAIATLPAGWARLALMAVLVPFWISIIVRTTAWFVLLQREGPVNAGLLALGLVDAPVQIMFTRFAVYLAMVHVLLPFAVLPLLAVMRRVDPRMLRAAASLGAPGWLAFWRVYLPLTLPGVRAGGLIVFMLAAGFYITPALMGGGGDQMVGAFIAEYATASLNWGMAAALAVLLTAGVAGVVAAGRFTARLIGRVV
jgi:putative spermidine/putrescine transport system permease protein